MSEEHKQEAEDVIDKVMETFTLPEGHGNAQLQWNWSAILLFIPLIPYALVWLVSNSLVLIGLHVYALVLVLVTIRIIHVFKHEMWEVSNPFDFVMVELINFVQLTFHFGMAFYFLEQAFPGSFESPLTFIDGIYFSVATIVTLGYGDICPVSSYGKILSISEVLSGVWFIATVLPTAIADQAERMRHYRKTQGDALSAMEEAARKGIITPVDSSVLSRNGHVNGADPSDGEV